MKYTREEARESVKWYVEAYLNDNLDKDTYINGLMDELTLMKMMSLTLRNRGLKFLLAITKNNPLLLFSEVLHGIKVGKEYTLKSGHKIKILEKVNPEYPYSGIYYKIKLNDPEFIGTYSKSYLENLEYRQK